MRDRERERDFFEARRRYKAVTEGDTKEERKKDNREKRATERAEGETEREKGPARETSKWQHRDLTGRQVLIHCFPFLSTSCNFFLKL